MRWSALLLAAVLLTGCVGTDLQPPTPEATPSRVADPAGLRRAAGLPDCMDGPGGRVAGGLPALSLSCLGGDAPVAMASLRGPLVVNLWAVWCTPCRTEGPLLASSAAALQGRVAFVGVDTADPDPALAAEFARAVGWRYMQVQDPGHALSSALGLRGLPVTLFVAADGRVVYRHVGALQSTEQLGDLVAQHLGVT